MMMKRISVLLLVLLMLGGMAVTASAYDSYKEYWESQPEISVGDCLSLNLQMGEQVAYRFIAPETGTYVMWDESYPGDRSWLSVMDTSLNIVSTHNFGRSQFNAVAGETYLVSIMLNNPSGYEGQPLIVHLEKGVPATSINPEYSSYVGFVGESVDIKCSVSPANGIIDGEWKIGKPEMAYISSLYSQEFTYSFSARYAGKTSVTYTNGNGKQAVCTITFRDFEPITLGSGKAVTVAPGDAVGFKFDPAEAGYYYFLRSGPIDETGKLDYCIMCRDPEGYGNGRQNPGANELSIAVAADEHVLIMFTNHSEQTYSGTFSVVKGVKATSLTIEPFELEVGKHRFAWSSFGPEYSAKESLTWTSSNPDVLQISFEDPYAYACYVRAIAEGTAVLTATSESGLKASYTVRVGDKQMLVLDQPNTVTVSQGAQESTFEFTPTESGYYHFNHNASSAASVIVTKDGSTVGGEYFTSGKDGTVVWLDAGTAYQVHSRYQSNTATGTYQITASRINTVQTGWVQCNGIWFYCQNGKLASGWIRSGNYWYYLRPNGGMLTGWQKLSGKWYYLGTNGVMQTDWKQIGGKNYFFGEDGAMRTGWAKDDGEWFYMGTDGARQTGWVTVNNLKYFLDPYARSGWCLVEGKWYYFRPSGSMITGWYNVDGEWYYLGNDGAMQTGWVSSGGKWYYMNKSGVMQTGWVKVGNYWYYMASDGTMHTGWLTLNGNQYYMTGSGAMETGLTKIGSKYYYFSTGGIKQTGWQTINGVRHLFGSDGAAVSGWYQSGKDWYYLKANGAVSTGWVNDGRYWYYMNGSGAMQTGWVKDGNYWYYMNKSGVMVTGTQVINGKTYKFNSSGVWIG